MKNEMPLNYLSALNKPDTLEEDMTEFRVGYWRGLPREDFRKTGTMIVDYPDCPDVKDFIDPTWDKDERKMVVEYLHRGKTKDAWKGYSTCRICGIWNNGSTCLTDGKWVWPSGLAHYLEEHQVKPSQEFIDWVRVSSGRQV